MPRPEPEKLASHLTVHLRQSLWPLRRCFLLWLQAGCSEVSLDLCAPHEEGRIVLEPGRLGHWTSSTLLEFPHQFRCEKVAQIPLTFSIAVVHLNIIHQWIRDDIFYIACYPISVPKLTLSLINTVVHLLGPVLSLTVLDNIQVSFYLLKFRFVIILFITNSKHFNLWLYFYFILL